MELSDATYTAAIAAAAAIAGGLLAAVANRGLERLRWRSALIEKAEERRLASLERFLLTTNAWLDWLVFLEDQGWAEEMAEQLNARVKARDDAYRQLLLLASDDFFAWLTTVYNDAEYELKRTYAMDVRYGRKPSDKAIAARRAFAKLLREDLIARMRPEVAALRNPVRRRGWRD